MISSAYIQTSLQCNLACKHCFIESTPISKIHFDSVRSAELASQLASVGCKVAVITGGEPTLHIDTAQSLGTALFDQGIVPILYSNLTCVRGEDLRALRESGFFVIHTSLDSHDPEEHDWFRGRAGAFAKTTETIRIAVELNFEVWVRTTLTKFNYSKVTEIVDYLDKLGVDSFRVRPMVPIGRASCSLAINPAELRKVVEALLAWRRANKGGISIEFLPTCFEFLIEQADKPREVPCFVSKVFISPEGDVQGCNYFSPVVGNIFEEPLAKIWPEYSQRMQQRLRPSGICKSCLFWSFCHGGCKANNAAYGRPLSAPDPLCYLVYQQERKTSSWGRP